MKRLVAFAALVAVGVALTAGTWTGRDRHYYAEQVTEGLNTVVTWPGDVGKIPRYRLQLTGNGAVEEILVTFWYSDSQAHLPGDSLQVAYPAEQRAGWSVPFNGPKIDSVRVITSPAGYITVEFFR